MRPSFQIPANSRPNVGCRRTALKSGGSAKDRNTSKSLAQTRKRSAQTCDRRREVRRRRAALLACELDREFAVADAPRQAFGITGSGFLAVGGNQLAEGGEQADLRHAVAVDPIEACLGPGF